MFQIEFTLSWDTCQAKNSSLWNITLETWAAIVDSVPGVIVAPLEGNIKLPTKNKLDFARLEFTLAVKHLFALILKLLKSLKLLLINTETDKVCNFDLKNTRLIFSIQNSSDMLSCMFFLNHWLCHVQKIYVVFFRRNGINSTLHGAALFSNNLIKLLSPQSVIIQSWAHKAELHTYILWVF